MHRVRWWHLAPLGALLAGALLGYFVLLADLPDPGRATGNIDAPAARSSILITDRHDRLLYEVIDPAGSKHIPLALNQIPLACQQATVATEDSRFYEHPGVDLIAIGRAAWQNWRGGAMSGASTLTQQVARTLYLSAEERNEQTLRRKLREAWLALRLETRYSKDEILALYLNDTYYGHFAVGIEAAAQAYFGMHASELDLAQCALLAGLPQYPAGYNPIENSEIAQERQATVLRLMIEQGYLTPGQAQDAKRERLAYAGTPFPIAAPHFVMWAQGQLESLLSAEQLSLGGLRVTTTLDLDWQQAAEDAVQRRLAQLRPCASLPNAVPGVTCDAAADPARRAENAALVAVDPATGAVLAMVGSPDYFAPAISGAVNASLSLRQPGSAIKPLTYAAALDPERSRAVGQAPWTAATVIADLRTAFLTAEGEPYVPNNYDRIYHGPVSVRAALANSYNIPAVITLDHIGIDALVEQAARLGIPWEAEGSGRRSVVSRQGSGDSDQGAVGKGAQADASQSTSASQPSTLNLEPSTHYGLSLTLGGGEVRLLDLTAAYAAFANGGQRVRPYAIERVESLDGETIYESGSHVERLKVKGSDLSTFNLQPSTMALDPRVAYLITDILSDNNARLPAFGRGNVLELGRPAAAKTGTSTDWRDNWTVGYTPAVVAGVWVGNADNTPMKDVSGISGAGPIWRDFMLAVLRDIPASDFEIPDGLVQVEVCADSGLLPMQAGEQGSKGAGVQGSGSLQDPTSNPRRQPSTIPCPQRRLEWFIAGTEPTEVDRSHLRVLIDTRTGQPADETTPPQHVAPQTIWQLPPTYQAWARANNIPQLADGRWQMADGGLETVPSKIQNRASDLQPSTFNLRLTSPDPNRTYRINPGLPLSAQAIPITALAAPGLDGTIVLWADGAPLAPAPGPEHTAWWTLVKGQHTFQAIARLADGQEVRSAEVIVFVE